MSAKTNVYECMFILDTNKVAGNVSELSTHVRGILEKHGAEIVVARPWDDRKLCYPVKGQKKALYYLVYAKIVGPNIAAIEHDCHLSDYVLRHMFVKIDPKYLDTMLALAQEDRPVALQMAQQDVGDDMYGMGGDDRGGRRGGGRRFEGRD